MHLEFLVIRQSHVTPIFLSQPINRQKSLSHFLVPENNFAMIVTEMASGVGFIILLFAINKGKKCE
jgi:hypothetical protein